MKCSDYSVFLTRYGLSGFPSMVLFSKGNKKGELYRGYRDTDTFINWLTQRIGRTPTEEQIKADRESLQSLNMATGAKTAEERAKEQQLKELKDAVAKSQRRREKAAAEAANNPQHEGSASPASRQKEFPPSPPPKAGPKEKDATKPRARPTPTQFETEGSKPKETSEEHQKQQQQQQQQPPPKLQHSSQKVDSTPAPIPSPPAQVPPPPAPAQTQQPFRPVVKLTGQKEQVSKMMKTIRC